ncbi:MAG: signal peptide peptidase SppA [archaeon]
MEESKNKWIFVVLIVAMLGIISFLLATAVSVFFEGSSGGFSMGNVAHIAISGPIITESGNSLFSEGGAQSSEIVQHIKRASADPSIKAILLEINSPGGSPVATEEIARAIQESDKLTVSWIRDVGASGAYWVASSTDAIVASRMSLVGSVGVIGSYLEFSGLMDKYGVSYQRFVSGQYKDTGVPYRNATAEERELYQHTIDLLQGEFLRTVAENRRLSEEAVEDISTARIYLGVEAMELGLIDVLGGKEVAISLIEDNLGIRANLVEFREKETLIDVLGKLTSQPLYYMGRGIGSSLMDSGRQNILI